MRPDYVDEEHLTYLDNLRESGVTNMFGATPFLMHKFAWLTQKQARDILSYWMNTFGDPNR